MPAITASARFAVEPLDLDRSLKLQRFGHNDFTAVATDLSFAKTFDLDSGVHRATYRTHVDTGELEITIEGPRSVEMLADVVPHYPPADQYREFAQTARAHRLVDELHRTKPGLRYVRVPWLFDVAASMILQQRVKYIEAAKNYYAIARAWGPKSDLGHAFPTARKIARLLPAQLQALGIDRQRSATLIRVAREQAINDVLNIAAAVTDVRRRLLAIAGMGPWTTEMIMGAGYGDPDALSLGDFWLPSVVCWILAREPKGDDARMEQLLAPFVGHRGRVARMLSETGVTAPF